LADLRPVLKHLLHSVDTELTISQIFYNIKNDHEWGLST